MAPIRGSEVSDGPTFTADLDKLREDYPEIDSVVEDLKYVLQLDYDLPHIPVDPDNTPGVYAVLLDYPPMGSAGRGLLLVTYHATNPAPSMQSPYRTFTLLTITER